MHCYSNAAGFYKTAARSIYRQRVASRFEKRCSKAVTKPIIFSSLTAKPSARSKQNPKVTRSQGVEEQSGKYGKGLLDIYPKWREPLPFAYESTGVETQFTNQLDPSSKSRNVFAFHKPETLLEWLEPDHQLNTRLAHLLTSDRMPTINLWSVQIEAIRNLEKSLAANKRPACIHAEEECLAREFGDQYRADRQRTAWRLFPFFYSPSSQPVTAAGCPRLLPC
jgi:hypothetical protein